MFGPAEAKLSAMFGPAEAKLSAIFGPAEAKLSAKLAAGEALLDTAEAKFFPSRLTWTFAKSLLKEARGELSSDYRSVMSQ